MFFYIKLFIGEWLYRLGYLAELTIDYYPQRAVYFGRTMRKWKRQQKISEKFRVALTGQTK